MLLVVSVVPVDEVAQLSDLVLEMDAFDLDIVEVCICVRVIISSDTSRSRREAVGSTKARPTSDPLRFVGTFQLIPQLWERMLELVTEGLLRFTVCFRHENAV